MIIARHRAMDKSRDCSGIQEPVDLGVKDESGRNGEMTRSGKITEEGAVSTRNVSLR
jgi:hypothetical protein